MAKKSKVKVKDTRLPAVSTVRYASAPARASSLPLVLGAVFMAVSAAASLALVVEHLVGLSLPGCRAGGACEQAANSVWGKVPVINWPTSDVGLAYFLAVLVTWLVARAALPGALRYIVRLGALGSLGFCVIIVIEKVFCPYCLVAHAGNFAFWLTMERTNARAARSGPAFASLAGVFILMTAVLGIWDWQHRAAVRQKGEQDLAGSTRAIIDASRQPEPAATKPVTTQPAGPPEPPSMAVPPKVPTTAPAAAPATAPAVFTGRYRHGPEVAPIRIVMFTGYQCPDCYNIEQQVLQIVAQRNDVSISIKHFPFNKDCNPGVPKTTQPNGCWAARAAEAAGILWGDDGFWKMHVWLFSHRGLFETQEELDNGIREMGYDPTGFVHVMSSDETQKRVLADVNEAIILGLHYTPMIFINGVELKGWNVPEALIRTVNAVAATNPPPRTAAADHPPLAIEKYVADWREQPPWPIPPVARAWTLGPDDAAVKVIVFGDYQEAGTRAADAAIRTYLAGHTNIQYAFRSYPFNNECNPDIPDRRHPLACRAAQAAKAAGTIGGRDGFWKLHTWLMENPDKLDDQALAAGATSVGLDAAALLAAMPQDDVRSAIAADIATGKPLGLRSIPWIIINGRWVPRWSLDDKSVLDRMFEEAAATPQSRPSN